MNVAEITTFLAIAELGSLVKASERLNVTQSAVTSRLRALELKLGEPLFCRNKSGATLTSNGFRFKRYAEAMNELWRQARNETSKTDNAAVINFGCHVDLWEDLGVKSIKFLTQNQPQSVVSFWPGKEKEFEQWLMTGLIDAAITYRLSTIHNSQKVYTLSPEDLIFCSTSQKLSNAELERDFVHVDSGGDIDHRFTIRSLGNETPRISFGSSLWAIDYLLKNGGSGYLPRNLIANHIKEEKLFAVPETPSAKRPRFLVINNAILEKWPWINNTIQHLNPSKVSED